MTTTALQEPVERVGGGWTAALSLANVAIWVGWYGPLQILLARQAEDFAPGTGMSKETLLAWVTGVGAVVSLAANPFFGALSDRIGRRNAMLCFSGLATIAVVPLLTGLGQVTSPYAAFALVMTGLAIISFYTSISGIVKAELFPTEVRALGVGLSYAVGNALFGGTAEYVALWFKSAGIESWFFWYVTALCAVAFVASYSMPDNRRHGYLEGTEAPTT
jgi:MHS family alpha-ketoglutarate permease-like MFS transporter